MFLINKLKHECTGCGACVAICPTNALAMCEDEEGFLYPEKDNAKCISCGLCEKKCPISNKVIQCSYPISTYAAYITLIPQHFDLTLFISS